MFHLGRVGSLTLAKYAYFGFFSVAVVVAWILRDYSSASQYKNIPGLGDCSTQVCAGKEAAMRTTLGGFLFFLFHALATCGITSTENPRMKCHTHFWPAQVFGLLVLETIAFLLPNVVVEVYFELARPLAGIFLVLQIIALLDTVYRINELFLGSESMLFKVLLITGAFTSYTAGLVGIGLMFHMFAPSPNCSLNIFLIVFTLILAVGYTALSLHPKVNAGMLTSGLVFAYSAFLCWSALLSLPPTAKCAFVHQSDEQEEEEAEYSNVQAVKVMGFLLALGAAAVATVRTAGDSAEGLYSVEAVTEHRVDLLHLTFALGCCYVAMLLSAWSLDGTMQQWELDRGWVSVWVKAVAQWITGAVYCWTMLAPLVLKDRDFNAP